MAKCPKCGADIEDGVKFCPFCGAEVVAAEAPKAEDKLDEKLDDAKEAVEDLAKKVVALNDTADTTADYAQDDIEKNKVMAVLAYFGILVLIPIFAAKDSKFARFHANQGLVLALNNGGFGGNGNWMWIIFLFFLYPMMRNGGWFGNSDGNGNCNGGFGPLANMINNNDGRQLLDAAINRNGSAIDKLASMFGCGKDAILGAISGVQQAICGVNGNIADVKYAMSLGNKDMAQQLASCCCDIRESITRGNYDNQLQTVNQTNQLQQSINGVGVGQERGFSAVAYESAKQTCEIKNAIKAYDVAFDKNPFSEVDLKSVHLVMTKDVVKTPGKYRTGGEGVVDGNGNVIFIAPPGKMVPELMSNLFLWTKENFNVVNTLILSSVFHYEFVFIHPFGDGNGRMARLWQNLILSKWKPIFEFIPIESLIKKYQAEYYEAIAQSNKNGDSTVFITFMLKMIDLSITELISETSLTINNTNVYLSKLLKTLIQNKWYTSKEIQNLLKLSDRANFRKNYLDPAIKLGLIEMEFPDKPTSKIQRYKKI